MQERNKRTSCNGEYASIFSKTSILEDKISNALEMFEKCILQATNGIVAAENETVFCYTS
jgi:glutaredoxin 2